MVEENNLSTPEPQRVTVRESRSAKTLWMTRDGMVLRVKDMRNGHLINSILLLRRRAFAAGRPVQEAYPVYEILMEEADLRKLTIS